MSRGARKVTAPATVAREAAGLTLQQAAKRLGVTPEALRRRELHGGAGDRLCKKAARLYGCRADVLFHSPSYFQQLEALNETGRTESSYPLAASTAAAGGADTQNKRAVRRTDLQLV